MLFLGLVEWFVWLVVGCGCGVWVLDSVSDIFVMSVGCLAGGFCFFCGVGVVGWVFLFFGVWLFWFCWNGWVLFCFLRVVLGFLQVFVESLILAQDERWRRA